MIRLVKFTIMTCYSQVQQKGLQWCRMDGQSGAQSSPENGILSNGRATLSTNLTVLAQMVRTCIGMRLIMI